VEDVLTEVLRHHPDFHLMAPPSQDGQILFFTIRRRHDTDLWSRMDELELALRDALYTNNYELRSSKVQTDTVQMQVTARG